MKYGDKDAKRRKHLVVVITADVRRKKLIGITAFTEGKGYPEPDSAIKHIDRAVEMGKRIVKFYGDGTYDTNLMFNSLHSHGIAPVIKIRKNASPDRYAGNKYRRREVTDYKDKGYSRWADENNYGMRWPGTEGIFPL
jgi:hypothetical protein